MTELGLKIKALRADNKTYSEISDILGCSKATISYHVGAGQKEKTGTRRRDNRNRLRKHTQEVKQSTPCADCGENYPYWMMDFDHLRDKSFGIADFGKISGLEVLKAEIEKCDVVCANCHRNRTHLRLLRDMDGALNVSVWYN